MFASVCSRKHLKCELSARCIGSENNEWGTASLSVYKVKMMLHTYLDMLHTHLDMLHTHLDMLHTYLDMLHTYLDTLHTHLDMLHTHLDTLHTLSLIHI